LCNRHLNTYNEERQGEFARVLRQHDEGLHGEGDDRKQFADQYESGEFYLSCQKCKDELKAEEIGVNPDQIEEGKQIQRAMEVALKQEATVMERFESSFKEHALTALTGNLESTVYALLLAKHWRRVQMQMELKKFQPTTGEYITLNLVDAYELVKEELTRELINNRLDTDNERTAASAFVRLTRW
jgi:hypothetical protein